jgi:lipoate-protein ligase A
LASVAEDLALDEALLIEADSGGGPRGVVRFWEPRAHAVVMGASRRMRDDVLVEACRADGVPILRRSSGGGTVVVGPGTVNVSVILPETEAPGLWAVDVAHRHVLDQLAAAIGGAGAAVQVQGLGDLTLGGRKCAGSAQRRLKHYFLVHCSILLDLAIDRIERYLAIPNRQPAYRAGRSHDEFLINLPLPRSMVVDAIRERLCTGASHGPAAPVPMALVQSLVHDKFANSEWIERL